LKCNLLRTENIYICSSSHWHVHERDERIIILSWIFSNDSVDPNETVKIISGKTYILIY